MFAVRLINFSRLASWLTLFHRGLHHSVRNFQVTGDI
uniref:Uncharacterized protein n=1 Tax=Anguilla anguilla TaxID=7936 RepID=A0A0E9QMF5_ANGAN